jgi:hypothetical protein
MTVIHINKHDIFLCLLSSIRTRNSTTEQQIDRSYACLFAMSIRNEHSTSEQ